MEYFIPYQMAVHHERELIATGFLIKQHTPVSLEDVTRIAITSTELRVLYPPNGATMLFGRTYTEYGINDLQRGDILVLVHGNQYALVHNSKEIVPAHENSDPLPSEMTNAEIIKTLHGMAGDAMPLVGALAKGVAKKSLPLANNLANSIQGKIAPTMARVAKAATEAVTSRKVAKTTPSSEAVKPPINKMTKVEPTENRPEIAIENVVSTIEPPAKSVAKKPPVVAGKLTKYAQKKARRTGNGAMKSIRKKKTARKQRVYLYAISALLLILLLWPKSNDLIKSIEEHVTPDAMAQPLAVKPQSRESKRLSAPQNTQSAKFDEMKNVSVNVDNAKVINGLAKSVAIDKVILNCGNGVTLETVLIPAGVFIMGSPASEEGRALSEGGNDREIQHQVTISRAFYMGVYEVTQAQYLAVMGTNPSHFSGDDNPVEEVSWNGAMEFCRRLSAKTGRRVRLPTEAEWEYACRARTTTPYNTGTKLNANYGWLSEGMGGKTTRVGSYSPNAWGLFDMHGNVLEWCADWQGDYSRQNSIDPQGASNGTLRIIRGGSWCQNQWINRSADRGRAAPFQRTIDLGFRVVIDNSEDMATLTADVKVRDSLDCGDGAVMELVWIPDGTFMMGSPVSEEGRYDGEIQHQVTISKAYYMGIYEVTQRQYRAVMGASPSIFSGADNPVELVSWDSAMEFCRRLSAKTGRNVRLPTEAEWEYACRAGTTTPFNIGVTIDTKLANYDGTTYFMSNTEFEWVFREKTTPAGSFLPNDWGLYDMHGNVWEWCSDWAEDHQREDVTAPIGPINGSHRVVRGGGWNSDERGCRSAMRFWDEPGNSHNFLGFRVVIDN